MISKSTDDALASGGGAASAQAGRRDEVRGGWAAVAALYALV